MTTRQMSEDDQIKISRGVLNRHCDLTISFAREYPLLIGLLERWLRQADSDTWRDGTGLGLKATNVADDTHAFLGGRLAEGTEP